MQKNSQPKLRSFVSNSQTIVPIILYYYNSCTIDHPQQKVAINKLISASQPFIVLTKEINENSITIENFLALLDERLSQEEAYIQEIVQLKNDCWEEFNELCHGVSDPNVITLIRNQRQRIIDYVFDLLKFEKRQVVGNFYDKMMNGYDDEAMEKFNKIIFNVLWKPFLTPLPITLIERIRNEIEYINGNKNNKAIEEMTEKIILFINEYLKNTSLKLSDFEDTNDLKISFSQLNNARKTCSIIIDVVHQENIDLVQEYRSKCIKNITINLRSNDFEEIKFEFAFNSLNLVTTTHATKIKTISDKIPKSIRFLTQGFFDCTNFEMEALRTSTLYLESLKTLTLDLSDSTNTVDDAGLLSVTQIIIQNKRISELSLWLEGNNNIITDCGFIHLSLAMSELFELIHLDLRFCGKNTSINEGFEALAISLKNMTKMSYLFLDFTGASIPTDAIDKLAISLGHMNQLQFLRLGFGGNGKNSANDNSFKLFAQAFKKMNNLNHLTLAFWNSQHKITDNGILQVSQSIANLKNLQELILALGLGDNEVTDKGIEELSKSISNLQDIQKLRLIFWGGNHCISDVGIQNISAALKGLIKLNQLDLDFGDGHNSVSDKGIEDLASAIGLLENLQDLSLGFYQGNNKISNKGMENIATAIKKTSNLKKLSLSFDGRSNTISREGINFLAEALITLKSPLEFQCYFIGDSNNVTEEDINYLKKVRTYSRFKGN